MVVDLVHLRLHDIDGHDMVVLRKQDSHRKTDIARSCDSDPVRSHRGSIGSSHRLFYKNGIVVDAQDIDQALKLPDGRKIILMLDAADHGPVDSSGLAQLFLRHALLLAHVRDGL